MLTGVLVIIASFLVYNYFEQNSEENEPEIESFEEITSEENEEVLGEETVAEEDSYTVKEGDTLWSIAEEVYGDPYQWPEIAESNDLEKTDAGETLIEIGQKLNIPEIVIPEEETTEVAQAEEEITENDGQSIWRSN